MTCDGMDGVGAALGTFQEGIQNLGAKTNDVFRRRGDDDRLMEKTSYFRDRDRVIVVCIDHHTHRRVLRYYNS